MCMCVSFIYVIYVLILYMPILSGCFTCGCLVRDDLIKKYKQIFRRRQFECIFLNENVWISFTISMKCVLKVQINNIPALVQIMAWRRTGDKPSFEPMMTHICVTRPKWIKDHRCNANWIWSNMDWVTSFTYTVLQKRSISPMNECYYGNDAVMSVFIKQHR